MGGEWHTHSFEELVAAGTLEIGDGYRAKNEELGGDGPVFLRAGHVRDTHIDLAGADRFHSALAAAVAPKMSRAGDVIVTTKGNSTGRTSFVGDNLPPVVYSPHLSYWRSRDLRVIVPGFLRYWSRSAEFRVQLAGMAASSDMAPYLSLVDQRRLRITLPPPDEQRAIAHILGTLDDKIELNRRMSETLEAMARALFTSWFVDFDPVRAKAEGRDPGLPRHLADLFPDRLVDSELGEIPEGWGVGTFADFVEQLRDQVNPVESPDTLYRHFSIPAFDERLWPKEGLGGSIRSQKWRVEAGVVLLSKLNPDIERVWLVDVQPGDQAVCSTEFLVLRPRLPAGRGMTYCLARSRLFRQTMRSLVTGTSRSHQRAEAAVLLTMPTLRPPTYSVRAFEAEAEPLLARSLECRRQERTVAAVRDSLLPKLVSGTLRVTGAWGPSRRESDETLSESGREVLEPSREWRTQPGKA